jgi:hypothetical protein
MLGQFSHVDQLHKAHKKLFYGHLGESKNYS